MSEDETLESQPGFVGSILSNDAKEPRVQTHVERLGKVQGPSDAWRVSHMVGRQGETEYNESIITLLAPSALDYRQIASSVQSAPLADWEHTDAIPSISVLRDDLLIDLLEASIEKVPGLSVKIAFGDERLVLDQECQWHRAVISADDGNAYYAPVDGETLKINVEPQSDIKFRFHINPEKFPEPDELESSLNRVSSGLVSRADACGLTSDSYHSSHISSAV